MEKVFGVFMGASENAFQATAKVCRSREKRETKLQRLAILSNFHSSPLLFNRLQAQTSINVWFKSRLINVTLPV